MRTRSDRRTIRQREAAERQAAYDLLSDEEKDAKDEAWREAHGCQADGAYSE